MPITVALVNNMPDSAFISTERQFVGLLKAASFDAVRVEIVRYALPGIPHARDVAQLIDEQYSGIDLLWHHRPDALIVTGAEPLSNSLVDEQYWTEIAQLVTRAAAEIRSVMLSCLAAHVALYVFDGAHRVLLPNKCTGVFSQDYVARHRLTEGLPEPLVFPHSRLNGVPTEAVRSAGYEVLVASRDSGWTVASRPSRAGELILAQGHPEYDASTLLREYRRDVERYLTGVRPDLPVLPANCVAVEDEATIREFHTRVISEDPSPSLLTMLAFDEIMKRTEWQWRSAAVRFYANWINDVSRRIAASQCASSPEKE